MAISPYLNDRQFQTIDESSSGAVITRIASIAEVSTIVDTTSTGTSVSVGSTYYPSSSGTAMGEYSNLSVQYLVNNSTSTGTSELTLQVSNDDTTWHDATIMGTDFTTGTAGAASFCINSGTMSSISRYSDLNVKSFRFLLNQTVGTADVVKIHTTRYGL